MKKMLNYVDNFFYLKITICMTYNVFIFYRLGVTRQFSNRFKKSLLPFVFFGEWHFSTEAAETVLTGPLLFDLKHYQKDGDNQSSSLLRVLHRHWICDKPWLKYTERGNIQVYRYKCWDVSCCLFIAWDNPRRMYRGSEKTL